LYISAIVLYIRVRGSEKRRPKDDPPDQPHQSDASDDIDDPEWVLWDRVG